MRRLSTVVFASLFAFILMITGIAPAPADNSGNPAQPISVDDVTTPLTGTPDITKLIQTRELEEWQVDFLTNTTKTGVYSVDGGDLHQDESPKEILLGLMTPISENMWGLHVCGEPNQIFAHIEYDAESWTELKKLYDSGFMYVALYMRHVQWLDESRQLGLYNIKSVEDVRAFAQNGYCGEAPPNHPTYEGVNEELRRDWYTLRPVFPRRFYAPLFPVYLWPQDWMKNLFRAHLGYETVVQGVPNKDLRDVVGYLDRVIFVEPDARGLHFALLPFIQQRLPLQFFVPIAYNEPLPPNFDKETRVYSRYLPFVARKVPKGEEELETSDVSYPEPAVNIPAASPAQTAPTVRVVKRHEGRDARIGPHDIFGEVLVTEDGGWADDPKRPKEIEMLGISVKGDRVHRCQADGICYEINVPHWISPARIGAVPGEMIVLSNSNDKYQWMLIDANTSIQYIIDYQDARRPQLNGGVYAVGCENSVCRFYAATDGPHWPWPMIFTGGPYGVALIEVDVSDPQNPIATEVWWYPTQSPVYEILMTDSDRGNEIHFDEANGTIHSFLTEAGHQEAAPVRAPARRRLAFDEKRLYLQRGQWPHTTTATDGNYLIRNTASTSADPVVVDLAKRSWYTAKTSGSAFTCERSLGVAVNHYGYHDWEGEVLTKGMLAVHCATSIQIYDPSDDWSELELFAEFELGRTALDDRSYTGGPAGAVAWLPEDAFIASINQTFNPGSSHETEFGSFQVHPDGTVTLLEEKDLDWNPMSGSGDAWQCEGKSCKPPLITPTPTSTMTNTPEPTSTPMPTNTPVPTATVPPPTPTAPPPCVPEKADIMFVADISATMGDEGELDLLKAALKVFVSLVRDDMDEGRIQLGLVSFADVAYLNVELTDDSSRVLDGIDSLTNYMGTRIDRGLERAIQELGSSRHRPDHAKVIILVTDGRQAAGHEPGLLLQAETARRFYISLFAVGLSSDVDEPMLRDKVASTPSHYYFSPTAVELEAIYRSIAKPCPTPTP